jgi:hypothetical protein
MKKFAVLFVLLFSASAFAQNKKFEIKGHVIGESTADFLAKEPAVKGALDNCLAEQSNPKSRWYKHHKKECQGTILAFTGGSRGFLGGNPQWLFDGGKLVRAYMDSTDSKVVISVLVSQGRSEYHWPQAVLEELIGKLGQPTSDTPTEVQNGFGAKWTLHEFLWTPPGVIVSLDTYPASVLPESVPSHSLGEWKLTAETTGEFEKEKAEVTPKSGLLDK